ncbi:MAG: hypothetical protein CMJ90_15065 [Planctomycetes bacterium]|nr:hypothetical protein [Planctomycetota bacterium]
MDGPPNYPLAATATRENNRADSGLAEIPTDGPQMVEELLPDVDRFRPDRKKPIGWTAKTGA